MYIHCFAVRSQTTLSCRAPSPSSEPEGGKENLEAVHANYCEWCNLCSNNLAAGVALNHINCSVPELLHRQISGRCHIWGVDRPHQQTLFVYLLKITPDNLILYYFNDSYSSQQYSPGQQLCTPNHNLDITKAINESCESQLAVLYRMQTQYICCGNFNVNTSFNQGTMEIYSVQGFFIEILVEYLDCCTRKCKT